MKVSSTAIKTSASGEAFGKPKFQIITPSSHTKYIFTYFYQQTEKSLPQLTLKVFL